jgi:hypothetical protein
LREELLQDLLEHLGGIIPSAALAALARAIAALLLLRHLLNHLHDLVDHAHGASASHYAA